MATCGHCKETGQTVAHVRTCGTGTVATAERPHLIAHASVVTLAGYEGYWLVTHVRNEHNAVVVEEIRKDGRALQNFEVTLGRVELVFPDSDAAVEYDLALRIEATKRRNAETLHGDPYYCRGCAKGWRGAKWHRDGCPNLPQAQPVENNHHASGASLRDNNPWAPVQKLRDAIKPHLNRETKRGKVRHFALGEDQEAKFYRVKEVPNGRVYVDAVAGGSAHGHDGVTYPVKNPTTLVQVLTEILANPDEAAKRYGQLLTRCSDCNRTLTDATSRALGIGPECRSKL